MYLTHDLVFAADRIGATKVCVTDYADDAFSWFAISEQQGILEDVFLEVLGTASQFLLSRELAVPPMPHFTDASAARKKR